MLDAVDGRLRDGDALCGERGSDLRLSHASADQSFNDRLGGLVHTPQGNTTAYSCLYACAASLDVRRTTQDNCTVIRKGIPFAEIVTEAAKSIPEVWDADGNLNLAAVARYYKRRGHPVTQPTLHRLFSGKHAQPSSRVIEATHHVMRVPRGLLRGDPMSADLERHLLEYKLSTIFLARKLESLPQRVRDNIYNQIETAFEQQEQLQRAIDAGSVSPIDRTRPKKP